MSTGIDWDITGIAPGSWSTDTISTGSGGGSSCSITAGTGTNGPFVPVTGTNGYVLTTAGGGGIGTSPYWDSIISANNEPKSLSVKGDADFQGDITIKGVSLTATLEGIEKRLGILHVNPELESRWQLLKDLGEQYREIEKDLLEKERMWDILKK